MSDALHPGKSAAQFVPDARGLTVLRRAVQNCRGCDLYRHATQAVFGENFGATKADHRIRIMMIGEQPGDKEDIAGHPFVGPAGTLLMRCLEAAEIDPKTVYVTNAVKHFKWEPRGKIRLHKKPGISEVRACKPWLNAEIEAVHPKLIVCLGATAAQALLGPRFRVSQSRGELLKMEYSPPLVATVHPASVLRARSDEDRERQKEEFIRDLRKAKRLLSGD